MAETPSAAGQRPVLVAACCLVRVALHAAYGWWLCVRHFPHWGDRQRRAFVARWSRELLGLLQVQLVQHGAALRRDGVLRVANHVSWLDIVALNACAPSHFISKAEVGHWPLVGRLASASGTLYLERRNRRDALRMSELATTTLELGECVTLFPEGTTSDGTGLLPLHPSLLQAAIDAAAPVQPVVLRYHCGAPRAACRAAAYTSEDTLVGSIWRVLRTRDLAILATVLPPIATRRDAERRVLADRVQTEMQAALGRLAA